MTKGRRRLKQVERWLTWRFPAGKPVRVRIERFSGDDQGYCEDRGNEWFIRVRSTLPIHGQMETLLHEWAHAVVGAVNHGKKWGERHQRIYQRWFDGGGQDESRAL